jgi:hypothetical protein
MRPRINVIIWSGVVSAVITSAIVGLSPVLTSPATITNRRVFHVIRDDGGQIALVPPSARGKSLGIAVIGESKIAYVFVLPVWTQHKLELGFGLFDVNESILSNPAAVLGLLESVVDPTFKPLLRSECVGIADLTRSPLSIKKCEGPFRPAGFGAGVIASVLLIITLLLRISFLKIQQICRRNSGLCQQCAYPIHPGVGRCPECGEANSYR